MHPNQGITLSVGALHQFSFHPLQAVTVDSRLMLARKQDEVTGFAMLDMVLVQYVVDHEYRTACTLKQI